MTENGNSHRDCRNFAPVDVAKGICHISKNMIEADGACCDNYVRLAKCKYCKRFASDPGKIELGICEASMNSPKFVAYPDMVAITCEFYEET